MKVLFLTRPTVFSGPGGDTVQLLKTKEYLEQLGVTIHISDDVSPELSSFDLIHFFNLRNPQDILINVRRAKKAKIPIVLSTIWGSYYECDQKMRTGIQKLVTNHISEYKVEYLKALTRTIVNGNINKNMLSYFLKGHLPSQKEICQAVNVVLPNSPTELERVKEDMDNSTLKGEVVANAFDLSVFDFDKVNVEKYAHLEGCILSAARIEIRKSQLDLIRAIKGLPYKLVIVGMPSPNSQKYYQQCKEEAGDNVIFINHVKQNELAELYKVAKAHALISWMETPGLSSIEAAVMECNLLITDRGDTKYYFQDMATYCEPNNIPSIKEGIIDVMENPFNNLLKTRMIENFTWHHTAKQTLHGYKRALNGE